MRRKNKNSSFFFIFFYCFLFNFSISIANDNINFLSLKNEEVNLRTGPSFNHPIKLIYNKKYLPVIILDKFETWREIKDFENNSGWIHVSQLSKKKSAINIKKNSILYKSSTIYSQPIAKLKIGRLVLVNKCKKNWCKISSAKFDGWIFKNSLWGKIK
jgi:SH3-like domain-containing protein|tara:strand:+ start:290 stop:763 length:474 start_codon:yes stop_codon:yes gene_type:complete